MSAVVIVDSSVLLNILDVPGRNQHREDVLDRLGERIGRGSACSSPWRPSSRSAITLPMLPMAFGARCCQAFCA